MRTLLRSQFEPFAFVQPKVRSLCVGNLTISILHSPEYYLQMPTDRADEFGTCFLNLQTPNPSQNLCRGPIEVAVANKPASRKKVDLGGNGVSPGDIDAKYERVLAKLQSQLGKNHPEVRN